ncbi:hypothetical protein CHL76_07575 [Marinococcus halophilus]|uniref:DUF624 domain-containing protein n=1 Tax=Marinococcus halophilus TaxID=1371 RepID=A0A510Y552_MARHA|nr:DUF624 domain-containing protein [Marinococcus halophilus]OZT80379.1 hypothetical protein CHL76_07575 [Marinococcus halophilus]GEK58445.1 hypothetical protein MHA01_13500 [Marinococcus halophilus]
MKVLRLMEWVVRAARLNLYWLAGTVAGGIIFGWAPATAAVSEIWKKELAQECTSLRMYFKFYKQFFWKMNLRATGILVFMTAAGMQPLMLQSLGDGFQALIIGLAGTAAFVMTVMLIYLLIFSEALPRPLSRELGQAFLLSIGRLPLSIGFIAGGGVWLYLVWLVPGLTLFFGASVPIFYFVWLAHWYQRLHQGVQDNIKINKTVQNRKDGGIYEKNP